ncbi:PadR family transcriptional regulator [Deinococcus sp. Arct2-2]|uniref:PadR family transcriptional regulator n=1 Tax=Deinococcus sp. Arct2-2 TaxID=2568653 RepID=UPI0010A50A0B|nr:PadR family transcriptional regulator [Deinococcus sp. Arct2-2]THF71618.1 PadR family transcriptional regulator [Deinococcus sp. Arct2-2]
MEPNLLKGHLDLILLAILEGGPMYGLEISKQAQVDTDGYFDLRVGSLYPALHRLELAGAIDGEFRPAPRGGAPVKTYWLTDDGRTLLARKRQEFRTFSTHLQALGRPYE